MDSGRGGYGGRRGRTHASDIATNDIHSGSSIYANDNKTFPENTSIKISSSPSNTTEVFENQSLGDTRKQLYVLNGLLANSSECSRRLTNIFKERIYDKAYTWGKMSPDTKNFYFEEFKKYYVWDLENEKQVKDAWNVKASQRCTDLMRELRGKMVQPEYISDNAWRSFQDYWETTEYMEKQEINTENRLKSEGSSTHTRGSISYFKIAKKLESILNRPPTEFELFLYSHTKDHGKHTFISDISKEVN